MKEIKFICVLLLIHAASYASVLTVNNISGGQYADINSAVVAALPGDTIYVCGSSVDYAPPGTRKAGITFIGTGFNVQKQNPFKSTISSGAFQIGEANVLIGLVINGQIDFSNYVNSLKIKRCYLANSLGGYYAQCNNLTVDKCICASGLLMFHKIINLVISNTIFYGGGAFNQIQDPGNAIVDHCTFIQPGGSPQFIFGGPAPVTGFSFSNNIFYNCIPNTSPGYSFINNYSPASNLNSFGSGNIYDNTWPFVQNQGSIAGAFNFNWDFRVVNTSSAFNASIDGTDIGAYGGDNPFLFDGTPDIPQMNNMNIQGTRFTSGSVMHIDFQSGIHN